MCLVLCVYVNSTMASFLANFLIFIIITLVFANDQPELLKFQTNFISQPLGSSLVLLCNSIKGTKPLEFKWFKDGHEIFDMKNDYRYSIEKKNSFSQLTVNDVSINDSGNYSCLVTNKFGLDSQWSQFNVKGLIISFYCFLFCSMIDQSMISISGNK